MFVEPTHAAVIYSSSFFLVATLLYERNKYLTHSASVSLQTRLNHSIIWKFLRILLDSSLPFLNVLWSLCSPVFNSLFYCDLFFSGDVFGEESSRTGEWDPAEWGPQVQAEAGEHTACAQVQTVCCHFSSKCIDLTFVPYVRVHELEEQLKDQETRGEQSLLEELRRHREAFSKMERDKNTQIELLANRWDTYKLAAIVWAGEACWLIPRSASMRHRDELLALHQHTLQELKGVPSLGWNSWRRRTATLLTTCAGSDTTQRNWMRFAYFVYTPFGFSLCCVCTLLFQFFLFHVAQARIEHLLRYKCHSNCNTPKLNRNRKRTKLCVDIVVNTVQLYLLKPPTQFILVNISTPNCVYADLIIGL